MLAAAMPLRYAVRSSLMVLIALSLTTPGPYAVSSLVD